MMRRYGLMLIATMAYSLGTAAVEQTRVRVINGVPNSQGVNVTLGGQPVFQGVKYKQVTDYKILTPTQNGEWQVTQADGAPIRLEDGIDLDDDDYTILIMPSKDDDSAVHAKVLETDDSDEAGSAAISLINASHSVQAADLFVGEKKVHAGVNPGGINGPDDVNVGNQQIKLHDGRANSDIIAQSLNLEGGKTYTAVVFGPGDALIIDDARPQIVGGAGQAPAVVGRAPDTNTTAGATHDLPGSGPSHGGTPADVNTTSTM